MTKKHRRVNAAEELAAAKSSGSKRTSGARHDRPPPHDLGLRLGECGRGRGQELRFRLRLLERDDGTVRKFLEVRVWSKAFDGWFPSRMYLRFRPEELHALLHATRRAIEELEIEGPAAS